MLIFYTLEAVNLILGSIHSSTLFPIVFQKIPTILCNILQKCQLYFKTISPKAIFVKMFLLKIQINRRKITFV